jgi:hypothetical protein
MDAYDGIGLVHIRRSSEIPMPPSNLNLLRKPYRLLACAALFILVFGVECPRVIPVEPRSFDGEVAGMATIHEMCAECVRGCDCVPQAANCCKD